MPNLHTRAKLVSPTKSDDRKPLGVPRVFVEAGKHDEAPYDADEAV
jgi:hypothetical protein